MEAEKKYKEETEVRVAFGATPPPPLHPQPTVSFLLGIKVLAVPY